jgi:hypothetical protein
MWKYLALVLVIPFLFSCASRKLTVTNTQTKTYTDSVSVEKKDSVSVKQNAIVIKETTNEIEITPVDTSKPVIIGDTKYYNSIIRFKKKQTHIIDSSKTMITQTNTKDVRIKKKSDNKSLDKKVDKKPNYWVLLWLLLIPFTWFVLRRLALK